MDRTTAWGQTEPSEAGTANGWNRCKTRRSGGSKCILPDPWERQSRSKARAAAGDLGGVAPLRALSGYGVSPYGWKRIRREEVDRFLQRRGRFRRAYTGRTLRENLAGWA
jgi:hypothetical protein